MTASLHNSLIGLVGQALRGIPAPLRRALDAWSHRVARRRALRRQHQWMQRKAAAAASAAPQGQVYHLKPWRD